MSPRNLTATGTNQSSTYLTWTPLSDPGIQSYTLYVYTGDSINNSTFVKNYDVPADATGTLLSGLAYDNNYMVALMVNKDISTIAGVPVVVGPPSLTVPMNTLFYGPTF